MKRLAPDLERIECSPGQVLADVDRPLDDIFFPETAVISVVAVYEDGGIIEMATIGREGCTGAQAVFGARVSPSRLLVQIPGIAMRMPRDVFMRAMETMPSFRTLMHAYAQAFLEQVLVSVACNGSHSLSQRFARWLLMMRDRSDSDALQITQTLLGDMLGVQRPTITNAAREFERAGPDRARPPPGHHSGPRAARQGGVRMLSPRPHALRVSPAQDLCRLGHVHDRQPRPLR